MTTNTSTASVSFQSATLRSGPAPHGQAAAWHVLADLGERPGQHLNLPVTIAVDPAVTDDAALAAVHTLVMRHEALRSLYDADSSGEVWTRTLGEGDIEVRLVRSDEPDLGPVTNEVIRELREQPFDLARDVPVRAAVVRSPAAVHLVVVTALTAADGWSMAVLRREAESILDGTAAARLPPLDWQPLDQGAYERSDAGRQASTKALDHWRTQLAEAPAVTVPTHEMGRPRYWHAALESPALSHLIHGMAQRRRVAASAVVLGAMARLLGRHDGAGACLLNVVASNRYHKRLRDTVGHFSQSVPLRIDVGQPRLLDTVTATHVALLSAARYGNVDPVQARRLVNEVVRSPGTELQLGRTFNLHLQPAIGDAACLDAEAATRLLPNSTFGWRDTATTENMTFYAHVWRLWPVAKLSFWIDTAYIARSHMAMLAMNLEDTLVDAATSRTLS